MKSIERWYDSTAIPFPNHCIGSKNSVDLEIRDNILYKYFKSRLTTFKSWIVESPSMASNKKFNLYYQDLQE